MPFALHTCGVTTISTLHTNSYRTRLAHHYPTPHDPHALQEGRRLRSSRGRLRAASRNTTGKKRPAATLPLQASEVLTVSARQSSQQTSHSQIAQRLLPPTRRTVSRTARHCSCSGQASLRPRPGQEHRRAVQKCQCCATTALFLPSNRHQTLPGSRLPRSLPDRDCYTAPAGIVPHRHPLRGSAGRSSPAWPRRRSPALPSAAGRAVINLQMPN
jgi:hypothetical protein